MSFPCVTAREAARLLDEEGYGYLDVRSVVEFELGHVAGAYNVPWAHDELGFLALVAKVASAHAGLVVGCQTGVRSQLACDLLRSEGYQHVVEQRAGFGGLRDGFGQLVEPGWQRVGLPVSYEALPGRSYRALCDADGG